MNSTDIRILSLSTIFVFSYARHPVRVLKQINRQSQLREICFYYY